MPANFFDGIPETSDKEQLVEVFSSGDFRIERIVSFGQSSPEGFWYEQSEEEWVLLLEGSAVLLFEDGGCRVELNPGSYLHIPARCRHRVEQTSETGRTVWLAVFCKPAPSSPPVDETANP